MSTRYTSLLSSSLVRLETSLNESRETVGTLREWWDGKVVLPNCCASNNSWTLDESIGGGFIQSQASNHTTWPIFNQSQRSSKFRRGSTIVNYCLYTYGARSSASYLVERKNCAFYICRLEVVKDRIDAYSKKTLQCTKSCWRNMWTVLKLLYEHHLTRHHMVFEYLHKSQCVSLSIY